jgi:Tol biopolymer transport system component
LLGADGITYRSLDEVNVHERDVFLAPDGLAVLLTERNELTPSIVHVDLVTGARREYPFTTPQSVVIQAWSPDGRYVAFGESDWNDSGSNYQRAQAVHTGGTFALLDLVTGTQTPLSQVGPSAAAAFSPDSTRLAV